jgi:hypothetical protein
VRDAVPVAAPQVMIQWLCAGRQPDRYVPAVGHTRRAPKALPE